MLCVSMKPLKGKDQVYYEQTEKVITVTAAGVERALMCIKSEKAMSWDFIPGEIIYKIMDL